MFTSNNSAVDWTDDWSWDGDFVDDDKGLFFPITPDYSDPNNLDVPIDSWHQSACETSDKLVTNILVEEWDGYVWRRVMGNGPAPGRDIENVTITDTLPEGVVFKNFIRNNPLGISATTTTITGGRTVIRWAIPKMLINQKDSIIYTATVEGSCPGSEGEITNKAWMQGSAESPINSSTSISVTCKPVSVCPEPTTFIKTSDKNSYTVGEIVNYSMEFTQTLGSIASATLNDSDDWALDLENGNFLIENGQLITQGFSVGKAFYNYSYGTNTLGNGIEGTIQLSPSEGDFAFIVRDDIYIRLNSDGGSNPTTVDIYDGNTKLNASPFSIPFFASYFDFRIQLAGETLSMWLVTTGDPISGAPSIVQTGIPVKAGYAGVSHGLFTDNAYASHTVTNWRTHLDAAFNVVISDSIPDGIINPTAISNSGVLNAGEIKWQFNSGSGASNAMLYGQTATLTWEGVYDNCSAITNIAYVNTLGVEENLYGDCYEITCGSIPTCLTPTTATLTPNPSTGTACSPDKVLLTAVATGTAPTGGWQYEFFDADGQRSSCV